MRHTKILCVVHLKLKFEWTSCNFFWQPYLLVQILVSPPHWPLSPSSCSSGGAVCGMCVRCPMCGHSSSSLLPDLPDHCSHFPGSVPHPHGLWHSLFPELQALVGIKCLCSGHKICPVSLMTPLSGFLTTGRKALQNPLSPETSPPTHVPLSLYLQAPAPNSELTTFLWGDQSLPHKDLPPLMAYSPCFSAGKIWLCRVFWHRLQRSTFEIENLTIEFLFAFTFKLPWGQGCLWLKGGGGRKKWLLYDFTWLCSYS